MRNAAGHVVPAVGISDDAGQIGGAEVGLSVEAEVEQVGLVACRVADVSDVVAAVSAAEAQQQVAELAVAADHESGELIGISVSRIPARAGRPLTLPVAQAVGPESSVPAGWTQSEVGRVVEAVEGRVGEQIGPGHVDGRQVGVGLAAELVEGRSGVSRLASNRSRP